MNIQTNKDFMEGERKFRKPWYDECLSVDRRSLGKERMKIRREGNNMQMTMIFMKSGK